MDTILNGEPSISFFDSGPGRLSFVCGALVYDKPFLAPLFRLADAPRNKYGRNLDLKDLPPYIKRILHHLKKRLGRRAMVNCKSGWPRRDCTVERFRIDANVEGQLVTVGGYQAFIRGSRSPTRMPHGSTSSWTAARSLGRSREGNPSERLPPWTFLVPCLV